MKFFISKFLFLSVFVAFAVVCQGVSATQTNGRSAVTSYPDEPADTFLNVKIGVLPSLPDCPGKDHRSRNYADYLKQRCLLDSGYESQTVFIPIGEDNVLGFHVSGIRMSESSLMIKTLPWQFQDVLAYLTAKYGEPEHEMPDEYGQEKWRFNAGGVYVNFKHNIYPRDAYYHEDHIYMMYE